MGVANFIRDRGSLPQSHPDDRELNVRHASSKTSSGYFWYLQVGLPLLIPNPSSVSSLPSQFLFVPITEKFKHFFLCLLSTFDYQGDIQDPDLNEDKSFPKKSLGAS